MRSGGLKISKPRGCRVLLRQLATLSLVCLFSTPAWGLSSIAWSDEHLVELSAGSAVEMLCGKEITAERYARALLARVHNYTCINSLASFDSKKVSSEEKANRLECSSVAHTDLRNSLLAQCSSLGMYIRMRRTHDLIVCFLDEEVKSNFLTRLSGR